MSMLRSILYFIDDMGAHLDALGKRFLPFMQPKTSDVEIKEIIEAGNRLVQALHPSRMILEVAEVIIETASTKTYRLRRIDQPELPPFRPGQYIEIFLQIKDVHTSRAYSISSPPAVDYLDITIKDNPGGFVAPYLLENLKVGDKVDASGPFGHFYYEPLIDGKDLVFIAGGSGITPFMSMIRWMLATNQHLNIDLIYGCRLKDDVIFGKELALLNRRIKTFKYALVVSEPPDGYRGNKGYISAEIIKKRIGDVKGKTFYLCGPAAMYDHVLPELEKLGVPEYKIKRELYGPPADIGLVPGFPKKINDDTTFTVSIVQGGSFPVKAKEPLLNSLERNGLIANPGCRCGECSVCRVKLLDGQVFIAPQAKIRQADRACGYIHACVSYPVSDIKIRL